MNEPTSARIEIDLVHSKVYCAGQWLLPQMPDLEQKLSDILWPKVATLAVDVSGIQAMDTAGAWLLQRTLHSLEIKGCKVDLQGLSEEHATMLKIMPELTTTSATSPPLKAKSILEILGRVTWPHVQNLIGILSFFGESVIAVLRSMLQPSRIRWRPIFYNLQHAGFNALPIVGLLAFLMGVVISFQGAGQLQRYGANIFIVDLVGLSILRELAPLMTAIIVAGRSGSAFAAQIGTMKMTEELDALRTIGIAPMDLLVLPKVLALLIALPLLTVFADIMGVLGGMVMAQSQLGVSYTDFLDRFGDAVKLSALLVGIGKAPVFAAIIAMVGCYQGFNVGNGADSVGNKTTASVVQGIFLIIVADALFSVLFSWLSI
jgi:phospholipid/cholesterol/gamma-HCH transport system permease protein